MLRPYQLVLKLLILKFWRAGVRNVLAVLPTGAGKTVLFSNIIKNNIGAACVVAHRQELVCQISSALNKERVYHRIIGPRSVVKLAVAVHMAEENESYYRPDAPVAVAGVDTLIRRPDQLRAWARTVTLWVMDEAHHVLVNNKWGKAVAMFPNARGLGVTATPERADGRGLGREYDGVMDKLVVGVSMRELIIAGFLSDYRVFAPPSDLDLTAVKISKATGEYNRDGVVRAIHKSHVVGDVVKHYLRIAPGKLGVTFASDVKTAHEIAAGYNAADVPAAVVHAGTPDADRVRLLREFRNRKILQLVNVDLFGEGFDLPALEVCSMARPTQSYALYAQQFGRALRIFESKGKAIIIDHVGNVERHGLPDQARVWSLRRRDRVSRANLNTIPVRACIECAGVYERVLVTCPYCGAPFVPAERSRPDQVDGDLQELDADALAKLRGDVAKVDMPLAEYSALLRARYVPHIGQRAHVKRHARRQDIQTTLRANIDWWAGLQKAAGRGQQESYKRFYFQFGVDVLSAQALNERDATELAETIAGAVGYEYDRLVAA